MPAPTLMIDVALAKFGLRVCRYGSSGECNRRLGERSERTDVGWRTLMDAIGSREIAAGV